MFSGLSSIGGTNTLPWKLEWNILPFKYASVGRNRRPADSGVKFEVESFPVNQSVAPAAYMIVNATVHYGRMHNLVIFASIYYVQSTSSNAESDIHRNLRCINDSEHCSAQRRL